MPRSRLLLALLVVTTLLVDAAACRLAQGRIFPDPAMVLLLGLAFSQIGLLAVWLTLGTTDDLLRTATLIAGIAAWSRAVDWTVGSPAFNAPSWACQASGPLSLQAVLTVLFALPARWTGYLWSWSTNPRDLPADVVTGRWQFTVSHLLKWTTVTAVVATLVRYDIVLPPRGQWFETGIVLLGGAVAILGGIYVGSTSRHAVPKLAATLVMAGVIVGPTIHRASGPYVTLCVLETLVALLWVTASRAAGFAIHRIETSPRRLGDRAGLSSGND